MKVLISSYSRAVLSTGKGEWWGEEMRGRGELGGVDEKMEHRYEKRRGVLSEEGDVECKSLAQTWANG